MPQFVVIVHVASVHWCDAADKATTTVPCAGGRSVAVSRSCSSTLMHFERPLCCGQIRWCYVGSGSFAGPTNDR